jgi:HK97 family phage major capsid protein
MPDSKHNRQSQPENQPPENGTPVNVQRDGVIEVIRAEKDGEQPTVRLSVSSETPCLCYRWWNDQYQRVYEILDHSPDGIDRSRIADGLVIRDQHYGDQVALIPAPAIADKKLGGVAEWCSGTRAQELRQDCAKKLRRNVSVEGLVDPSTYRLEGETDGVPVVRAMRWTPLAAALVSAAPADPSVGVGRTITPPAIVTRKEPTMPENQTTTPAAPDPVAKRNVEASEMFVLARQHNVDPAYTAEAIKRGIDLQAFAREILDGKAATIKPADVTPGKIGEVLTPKEAKKFSLHRAIDAMARGASCFEREVSDELARIIGKPAQGLYIPNEIARTMSVVGTNGDAALVGTELLTGSFIEMLRAATCIDKLGVTRLLGMKGDVTIPKQLTGQTYYHVGRDQDVTASDGTFGLVKASPHTIGARTIVGRSMLKQSSLDAEALTQGNIVKAMSEGMDVKAFSGNGGDEPAGLALATDINSATVTTPGSATWANILTFLSTIAADNVALNSMKWAMPTNVLFNLAGIPKVSGQSEMLAKESAAGGWTVAGYPVVLSNNVTAKSAFFGAWSEFYWVMWGAVDITVNPYTYDAKGAVVITALQDYDHLIAHGQAFSYNAAVIS